MAPSSPDSSPPDPAEVVESLQNLSVTSPVDNPEGSDPVTEANIVEDLPEVTANPHAMSATAIQPHSSFYMPTSYYNEGYGGQSQEERNPSRHSNREMADYSHVSHYTYPHGYPYGPYMPYTPPASPASSMGNEVQHYKYPAQSYNPSDQTRRKCDSDKEAKVAKWLSETDSGIYSTVPHTNSPLRGKTHDFHAHPNTNSPAWENPARSSSTFNEAPGIMSHMYPTNETYSHQVDISGAGFRSYNNRAGWWAADVKKGQNYGTGVFLNVNRTTDILSEMRTGPRTKRGNTKGGEITAETEEQRLSEGNNVKNLSPDFLDQRKFDGENFPEEYSCAKFFVIKSFNEDDVHKSIKYGFWASTPIGNRRLDVAFQGAKQNLVECPVFLFFSVNASGKFVGLAEMVGPVDFNKTLEYWQQDRWQGCIPVKWHIIKDVDNRSLMHIKLRNNENRSVTSSRDTQEVEFEQGMEMIKIFKSKPLTTSILDDMGFYDNRERPMQEWRAKQRKDKNPMPGVESDDSATAKAEKAIVETKESEARPLDNVLAKDSASGGVS